MALPWRRPRQLHAGFVVLAACMLVYLPVAHAGSGGVWATGWNTDADALYLRGEGKGVFLVGAAQTVYRFASLRTSDDTLHAVHPLWQSLHFSVRDDRARHQVAFQTSVRGSTDLARGGFAGEVLYSFVELSPEGRWGRFRVGRQIETTAGGSGFTRFDGVSARLVLHHLALESYAGVSLRNTAYVVVSPDEGAEETTDMGWGRDWTYSVAVATANVKKTQARLGLQDRFVDGRLARRHLTFDFHQGLFGIVGLRMNLARDLVSRQMNEVRAGVDFRIRPGARAGIEFEHWQPTFDANHLFSVFATDPYDELRARGSAQITPWLSVEATGGFQVYPEPITQDDVPRPELGDISGSERVGVTVSPTPFLSFSVEERLLTGTGGQKFGAALSIRATPWDGRLEVVARGDVQRYSYELQPGLEGLYGGVSVEVIGRPTGWVRTAVRLDGIASPWLKDNVQVTASLDFLTGGRLLARHGLSGDKAGRRWQPAVLAGGARSPLRSVVGLDGGIGLGGRGR